MEQKKNITIDALAQMTEERIQGVGKEVREGFQSMNESFGLVLEVLNESREMLGVMPLLGSLPPQGPYLDTSA